MSAGNNLCFYEALLQPLGMILKITEL